MSEKKKLSDLTGSFKSQAENLRERINARVVKAKSRSTTHHENGARKEHVVLVHGLFLHGNYTKILSHWLKVAGFTTSEFSYRTIIADLDENAQKLHAHFTEIDAEVVHGVGHSLGGVLLQHMYDKFAVKKQGRVVALGSPFLGSSIARYLRKNPMASAMLGKSIGDVLDSKERRWTSAHELGIIAGDVPIGLGMVFRNQLERPNDGTVAVSETKLPGHKEHIVVPVSHTALIFSPKTSQKVVSFLKQGKFFADTEAGKTDGSEGADVECEDVKGEEVPNNEVPGHEVQNQEVQDETSVET